MKALDQNKLKPSVAVVMGTRPEIIKLAPVLVALGKSGLGHFVIYTGQHYSPRMGSEIYDQLRLEPPRYRNHFRPAWRTHGEQTGRMLCHIESVLLEERPRWVLVQGDVNSTLAGALAAKKLGLRVAHLEAGLRSFDERMPEEHNRVMVDHIADLLLAPTAWAARQLARESVRGAVHVVGNTVVDALVENRGRARRSDVLARLGLAADAAYFLFTVHRQENLETAESMAVLEDLLRRVRDTYALPMVFPIHPGTLARLKRSKHLAALEAVEGLKLIPPVGYLDFLRLLERARLVFTDSGGVQEEACVLRVPTVTLRESTERPETLRVGSNRLAGFDPARALRAARVMLRRPRCWANPFGDGRAGERAVRLLEKEIEKEFGKKFRRAA